MNTQPLGERRFLIAGAILLALASLLGRPGVTAPPPALLLGGSGLLAILCGWICERRGFRRSGYLGPTLIVVLLLWAGLSTISSLAPYLSKLSMLNLTAAAAVLSAFHLGIATRSQWRFCCYVLLLGAVLSSLGGWVQLLTSENGLPRLSANFTNPDCYSVIPLAGLCLAAALMGTAQGWRLAGLMLSISILLPTMLLTQSRSSFLGLTVAVIVVISAAARVRRPALTRSLGLSALALIPVLLFLGVSTLWLPSISRWGRLLENSFDVSIRASLLQGSMACARQRPLLGSGPGTFALAFQENRKRDIAPNEYANVAHNDSLQFLVELGAPGLLLWTGLTLAALASAWGTLRMKSWEAEAGWVGGGLIAMLVYSQFNFAVPVSATLIWWSALLGLAYALPGAEADPRDLPAPRRTLVAAVMVLIGAWATVYGLRVAKAQSLAALAQQDQEALRWREAYQGLGQAIRMEPDNPVHRIARAKLAEDLAKLLKDDRWLLQADQDLKSARKSSPRDLPTIIHSYRFFKELNRHDEADEVLTQARDFAYYHPQLTRYVAASLLRQDDLSGATRLLAEGGGGPEMARLVYELERLKPGRGVATLALLPEGQSKRVLQEALEIAEKARQPKVLDDLYAHLVKNDTQPARKLSWAKSLSNAGDSTRAAQLLREILSSSEPQDPTYEQALVELVAQDAKAGQRFLEEHLKTHPDMSRVRVALSRLLPPEAALDLLMQGLAIQPSDPHLLSSVGDIYAADDMNDIALDYYLQARGERTKQPELDRKIKQLENK